MEFRRTSDLELALEAITETIQVEVEGDALDVLLSMVSDFEVLCVEAGYVQCKRDVMSAFQKED